MEQHKLSIETSNSDRDVEENHTQYTTPSQTAIFLSLLCNGDRQNQEIHNSRLRINLRVNPIKALN